MVKVCHEEAQTLLDKCKLGFWSSLQCGADLPSIVPYQRWDVDNYYAPDSRSSLLSMYVRAAAFVDDLDSFDAAFFRCPYLFGGGTLVEPSPPMAYRLHDDCIPVPMTRLKASSMLTGLLAFIES